MTEFSDADLLAAVSRQIGPANELFAYIGSAHSELLFRLKAVLAIRAADTDPGSPLDMANSKILGILATPGPVRDDIRRWHDRLWDVGLGSGWWSAADSEVMIWDDLTLQTIACPVYTAVVHAFDAVLLGDLLSTEEFDLLVAPVFTVLGPLRESPTPR